jgi:hypothetical protein
MLRKLFIMIIPVIIMSCGGSNTAVPEKGALKNPDEPAAVEPVYQTKKATAGLTKYSELSVNLNKKMTIVAAKSTMIMQHMMAGSPKTVDNYFDLDGGAQIVVYSLKPIPCKGKTKITGTVGQVSGPGKGPNKGGGTHSEYYLSADEWECME